MKISVLMPAYNAQAHLQEALDSVLGQDLGDGAELELVAVDDASTDDTGDILDAAARRDGRVRVVHRPVNGGDGPARASGMEVAGGDWLLCVDSDDLLVPGSLARLARRLGATEADVVLYRFRMLDDKTKAQWDCDGAWQVDGLPQDGFEPREHADRLYTRFWSIVSNKCLRMSFLREAGIVFSQVRRQADVPFMLSALSAARRVDLCPEFCYLYRVNVPDSLTHAGDAHPLSLLDASRELHARLEAMGLWGTYRSAFLNWMTENLPYNLRTMRTLEGYRALLGAFLDEGFSEFGLDDFPREQAANPWAWDHVNALRTQDLEHGLFDFVRRLDDEADRAGARADVAGAHAAALEKELGETRAQRDALAGSVSLRVGRAATAPLRSLRDLLGRG